MQGQKSFPVKKDIKNLKIEAHYHFIFRRKMPCACLEYYIEREERLFQPK